jgi:uncharacterized protein (TIRG00374 family)
MKRVVRFRFLIWVFVPLLVWWSLRNINFIDVWNTFSSLQSYKILILIALNAVIVLAMTSRWWFVLRAFGHRIPLTPLAGYRLSSFSVSYFTPGTQFGGEPLQVHFTRDRHEVPTPIAVAGVTLDKIFEVLTNTSFIAVGLVVFLSSGFSTVPFYPGLSTLLVLALALPLLYMLSLWAGFAPLSQLVSAASSFSPDRIRLDKIERLVTTTEKLISIQFRKQPTIILWMLFTSALIWMLLIAEYWLSLSFLGAQLNFGQALLALTAARIAFLMPLPGGIGALEASQIWAMQTLGLDPVLGVSLVLMIRARDVSLGMLGLGLTAVLFNRRSRCNDPIREVNPAPTGD